MNCFQQCFRQEPVNNLVIRSTINKIDSVYSINNITNNINNINNETKYNNIIYACEWKKYGRGWLLVPEFSNHPDYGEKYYCGGWWMPTQNAWFFRKEQALYFYDEFNKLHPNL